MKYIQSFEKYTKISETRLSELYFMSNRIDNIGNHKFKFLNYDKSTNTLLFRVDNKYNIDIRLLDDNIQEYADIFNSDVKVHCECNDFRYVYAYWAYDRGYGIKKELRPAPIRNPDGIGSVCKHITALATDIDYFEDDINKYLIRLDTKNIDTDIQDTDMEDDYPDFDDLYKQTRDKNKATKSNRTYSDDYNQPKKSKNKYSSKWTDNIKNELDDLDNMYSYSDFS